MSDRELLELAAKAIGKVYVDPMSWDDGAGWDPLTDDGDALRLAVKCNLTLMRVGAYPAAVINDAKLRDTTYYSEDCVRRAIVSAAAEIGKSMP